MIGKKFITVLMLAFATACFSQTMDSTRFEPSGKIIARSFFDVSQSFLENGAKSGFDVSRALLGYQYQFTEHWSASLVIDAASGNSNGKLEPRLRNAYVNWKNNRFDISIGMTGLLLFKTQEDYWQYRYVSKTIQDHYKMGHSVDLGITAKYKFNDYFSADLTAVNGEGYKQIVKNSSTAFGAGISITPVDALILRACYGYYTDGGDARDALPEGVTEAKYAAQQNISLFVGYRNDNISGGIEYARLNSKGFIRGCEIFGLSAFANIKTAEKWHVFARYDISDSKNPSNFPAPNKTSKERFIMAGAEYQPFRQLKIAPNIRLNTPKELSAFISFEINF